MELPRRRRKARKSKYDKGLYPQGVLNIIAMDYPHRYADFTGNTETNRETLFTEEEWLDILTKSRLSYEQWLKMKEQGLRNIK